MRGGYTYILLCGDGSFYTGSTVDLDRRLAEHQNGEGANHTRKYLPVELVYCEAHGSIADAFYREKEIQGWSRRKKLALIESRENQLPEFSRRQTRYQRKKE